MTLNHGIHWTEAEKGVASEALKKAYRRESESLLEDVKEKADRISGMGELWQLNDFLSARRHDIDGKYDDQEDSLMFSLSRLVKEGWLAIADLEDLAADKRAKIKVLTLI